MKQAVSLHLTLGISLSLAFLAAFGLPGNARAQTARDKAADAKAPADADDEQGDQNGSAGAGADHDSGSGDGDDSGAADLDALRREYLRLRDQLFRSRARAAAVGDALYSTRLQVDLHYTSARFYDVSRAAIRLDGANVYEDTGGEIAKSNATRFQGYVAPGRHQLTIRVEATGKDDDRFVSAQETTFSIQAPAGKAVTVTVTASDEGDIPYSWKQGEGGSYQLRLDARVRTQPLQERTQKTARRGNK